MLAHALLALALAQGCPEPRSAGDPPPCAAANVRGCLPGYRPSRDAYGRLVYVCDRAYSRAPGRAAPASPPEPQQGAGWDAPAYAQSPAPAAPSPGRGRIALVLMPGATTALERTGEPRDRRWERELAAAALELRGGAGGARVRFALQLAEFGRVAEVTLKYDFFDGSPLRPFVGLGLGAASVDPDRDWRASGSAVGGVDLYLAPNVFLTAEVQGRRFASRAPGGARGIDVSPLKQSAALVGIGMYL